MMPSQFPIPDDLLELTRLLIDIRKKPGSQERYQAYPAMLQRFRDLLNACEEIQILRRVLALDSGYYLLAGDRQRLIEKALGYQRTADLLRAYALQLELFGDVPEFGEANLEVEAKVSALHAEADALDGA